MIHSVFSSHSRLKRVNKNEKRTFSLDLALVAFGVRTGFLLDSFAPVQPVETFGLLLRDLRQSSALLQDVIHIHEPTSSQSFFINLPLFMDKFKKHEEKPSEILSIVSVDPVALIPEPPDIFLRCLREIESQLVQDRKTCTSFGIGDTDILSTSIELVLSPEILNHLESAMIPVAAFLLDYPVGYYIPPPATEVMERHDNSGSANSPLQKLSQSENNAPTTTASSHLNGTPLIVYTCFLKLSEPVDANSKNYEETHSPSKISLSPGSRGEVLSSARGVEELRHILLKFSCPEQVEHNDHEGVLDPCIVRKALVERFSSRLAGLGVGLDVVYEKVILDRVAL